MCNLDKVLFTVVSREIKIAATFRNTEKRLKFLRVDKFIMTNVRKFGILTCMILIPLKRPFKALLKMV